MERSAIPPAPQRLSWVLGLALVVPGCGAVVPGPSPGNESSEGTNGGLAPGADPREEWSRTCMLPPRDSDFDGPGDSCDNCPLVPDPTLETYVDDEGMHWPNDGAACNGDFRCQ